MGEVAIACVETRPLRTSIALAPCAAVEHLPATVIDLIGAEIADASFEILALLGFDQRGVLLFYELMSQRGASSITIDGPRILGLMATPSLREILVAHNHPSGDPTPSRADRCFTERLCDIARFCGITVIDHMVFAREKRASFVALRLL